MCDLSELNSLTYCSLDNLEEDLPELLPQEIQR